MNAIPFRICPNCGSDDVPTLVVTSTYRPGHGCSWRCHSCQCFWSDGDKRSSSQVPMDTTANPSDERLTQPDR
jgi:transposase-like protein